MNYWPTSTVLQNSGLRMEQKREIMSLTTSQTLISDTTLLACCRLVNRMPTCTSLIVMYSEKAPLRRVYLERPAEKDWISLERGGFVTTHNGFGFIMDAMH